MRFNPADAVPLRAADDGRLEQVRLSFSLAGCPTLRHRLWLISAATFATHTGLGRNESRRAGESRHALRRCCAARTAQPAVPANGWNRVRANQNFCRDLVCSWSKLHSRMKAISISIGLVAFLCALEKCAGQPTPLSNAAVVAVQSKSSNAVTSLPFPSPTDLIPIGTSNGNSPNFPSSAAAAINADPSSERQKSSPLWSAFLGAFFGVIGGLALRAIGFWVRRWHLTKCLEVYPDPAHGGHFRCRVYNGGGSTVKNAIIYITLPFEVKDTASPPPGHNAFIRPDNFVPLEGDQLCWSVRAPVVNPIKVDIYAKERQPFSPCALTQHGDQIIIPSEEGWPRPKESNPSSFTSPNMRVFLKRGTYTGILKVVSEDTDARFFEITINPDDNPSKIRIKPISKRDCKLRA